MEIWPNTLAFFLNFDQTYEESIEVSEMDESMANENFKPSDAGAFLFQLYKILEACKKILLFQQFYTHNFKKIFYEVSSPFC